MRPVGFSTGALSPGDAASALSMLEGRGATAIELWRCAYASSIRCSSS